MSAGRAPGTQAPDGGDVLTLRVDGSIYAGWTAVRVSRGIDRMATDFDIAVSERWDDGVNGWQLGPFLPCTVSIGDDLILTGYLDDYLPAFDAASHGVRIRGRSKTEDVIDCTPDLKQNQFDGSKLDAIARAICAAFGIDVIVSTDVGAAFPDATIQKHETGFQFLERLSRLRRVLLSDDPQGRLVLTTAGAARATDPLVQGANVISASATLSGAKRFSVYIVKAQIPVTTGGPESYAGFGDGGEAAAAPAPQTGVTTDVEGRAYDKGVPRNRPHTIVAESALDAKGAQERADWQARHALGRSTVCKIVVQGWRQSDGSLWTVNTLASVRVPYLNLDRELLIVRVTYSLDPRGGRRTEMELGPVEGYTPDPGQVRAHKNKGAKGAAASWDGFGEGGEVGAALGNARQQVAERSEGEH